MGQFPRFLLDGGPYKPPHGIVPPAVLDLLPVIQPRNVQDFLKPDGKMRMALSISEVEES